MTALSWMKRQCLPDTGARAPPNCDSTTLPFTHFVVESKLVRFMMLMAIFAHPLPRLATPLRLSGLRLPATLRRCRRRPLSHLHTGRWFTAGLAVDARDSPRLGVRRAWMALATRVGLIILTTPRRRSTTLPKLLKKGIFAGRAAWHALGVHTQGGTCG